MSGRSDGGQRVFFFSRVSCSRHKTKGAASRVYGSVPLSVCSVWPPRSSGEHGPPMDQTVVLCTLVAFLLYYNTLGADFAYDDR
jgi:hypothetical protein